MPPALDMSTFTLSQADIEKCTFALACAFGAQFYI